MRRYAVSISVGTLTVEVVAEDEDAAMTAAVEELASEATDWLCAGTFQASEGELVEGEEE